MNYQQPPESLNLLLLRRNLRAIALRRLSTGNPTHPRHRRFEADLTGVGMLHRRQRDISHRLVLFTKQCGKLLLLGRRNNIVRHHLKKGHRYVKAAKGAGIVDIQHHFEEWIAVA